MCIYSAYTLYSTHLGLRLSAFTVSACRLDKILLYRVVSREGIRVGRRPEGPASLGPGGGGGVYTRLHTFTQFFSKSKIKNSGKNLGRKHS